MINIADRQFIDNIDSIVVDYSAKNMGQEALRLSALIIETLKTATLSDVDKKRLLSGVYKFFFIGFDFLREDQRVDLVKYHLTNAFGIEYFSIYTSLDITFQYYRYYPDFENYLKNLLDAIVSCEDTLVGLKVKDILSYIDKTAVNKEDALIVAKLVSSDAFFAKFTNEDKSLITAVIGFRNSISNLLADLDNVKPIASDDEYMQVAKSVYPDEFVNQATAKDTAVKMNNIPSSLQRPMVGKKIEFTQSSPPIPSKKTITNEPSHMAGFDHLIKSGVKTDLSALKKEVSQKMVEKMDQDKKNIANKLEELKKRNKI